METDDGFEIGTAARELQRHRAAEAKADRGEPARIDLRQRGERRQRGPAAGAQRFRFVAEFANQLSRLLQIACLPAIAEHVGGQRHMAKLRQHPRPRHRELAQPQSLVKDQHARPPLRRGFIPGEISAQIGGLVAVVDVARLHGWSAFLSGTWNRNFTPL